MLPSAKPPLDRQALIASQPALARTPPRLWAAAELMPIQAGETLFRIGDRVRSIFSVLSGEVRLIRRDRNGSEVILQRSRGGFVAEASLDAGVYHCELLAAESGEILGFPAMAFRQALAEDADFRQDWMSRLAQEVRKLRAQCERLSLHGAAERILHYLAAEGSDGAVILKQSRKAWAAELGLTHEALYRTLRRLQTEGRLRIDGERIALNPPGGAKAARRHE